MNLKSIRWRLPFSYATIALLAALSLGSVMLLVLNRYYARQEQEYLLDNARALQPMIEGALKMNALPDNFQDSLNSLAFFTQTRIRVLEEDGTTKLDSGIPNPDQTILVSQGVFNGTVLVLPADSKLGNGTIQGTSNSTNGVEVPMGEVPQQVGTGGTMFNLGVSPYGYGLTSATTAATTNNRSNHRSSQSVNISLEGSLGTLVVSDGPAYGWDIIRSVLLAWAGASIIAILLAILAGLYSSRQVTHPVMLLTDVTHRMESGDLAARVTIPETKTATEFQALAHSFNGMAERVENTVSTLRAFVADAAHELHTPLAALHTNLELVVEEKDANRRSLFLERAQEQNLRLEALVNGLLDLSRIEAAGKSEGTSIELNPLVREIGKVFATQADQAKQIFLQEIPEETIQVEGSELHLRRILTNLLENALKFTPAGGKIHLRLEKINDQVILSVKDTGIGIPPEDIPHLFERFHRGRNASRYMGNGLGLAIVKALVEAQGGCVRAESEERVGTTIIVMLPLRS